MTKIQNLDVEKIRKDFPILEQKVNDFPLAYLDNAASTQKPNVVIEAIDKLLREYYSNVHRGVYSISEQATEAFEGSRQAVADFLHAKEAKEIVFCRNATEGLNLIAHAWGRAHLKQGDVVLLTEMEHHANLIPWQLLAKDKGVELRFVPITPDGRLDMAKLDDLLTPEVKLISVTQMSNVLGTVNPVKEIVTKAKANGAVTVIDGAQAAPHLPVNVQDIDCDFYVGTGHKMLGPTGSGFVFAKLERWKAAEPFLGGGHMINEVTYQKSTWNEVPYKFEAGTPDIIGVIGLAPAIKYLTEIGLDNIVQHEAELTNYALGKLQQIDGIELYGPTNTELRGGIISFNIKGAHSHDLATVCDAKGVAIRTGHHCAQPLVNKLGAAATARASFYVYNTKEEIDRMVEAINQAREMLT
ncbi:MAG: cysteine desulfurase [bacterium]